MENNFDGRLKMENVKLVDIGNTHFHIFDKKIKHLKEAVKLGGEIFYISVNEKKEKEFLKLNPHAVNLKKYVKFKTLYSDTLGIDRIMACKSIAEGVVVDAGTFVTVDVMEKGIHLGGVIIPGLLALKNIFKNTKALNVGFVYPHSLPKNTQEAVGEGSVGVIMEMIKKYSKNRKIYMTGGDGEFFAKILHAEYIPDLIFRGMIKTIKEDL